MARTRTLFLLIVAMASFGPVSTDLYLPALPSIGADLAAPETTVQLTLSVFIAGFAIAQLAYGPLSDRFGRRPVALAGLVIFVIASVVCALAPSIEVLIAARLAQAIGACSGPVLSRAVVRDVYRPQDGARVLAYVATATSITPIIGPMVGGALTDVLGWQINFWFLTLVGVGVLVAVSLGLAETNRHLDPTATRLAPMLRNYASLLRHRAYLGYLLIVAFSYGGIFSFISGSSFLLIESLGLRPAWYGMAFGFAVIGYTTGTLVSGRLAYRVGINGNLKIGLTLQALGGAGLVLVTFAGWLHVASIIGPVVVFLAGCGFNLPNGFAGSIGPFPRMAGAAAALVGFVQMTMAALIGIAVVGLADGTGRSMAAAMLLTALGGAVALYRLALAPARA